MINITLGNLIKFHILVSLRLDDAAAAAAGASAIISVAPLAAARPGTCELCGCW